MENEIWKDIKGYEGSYMVSNMGRIKSLGNCKTHKEKVLNPCVNNHGYLLVSLYLNRKSSSKMVHRIVIETFLSKPSFDKQVNHKNGNKTDNNISNLEWCTGSENVKHAFTTGLKAIHKGELNPMFGRFGGASNRSKKVIQSNKYGEYLNEFTSAAEAHIITGVNSKNISSCCLGKRQSAGGYIWRFKTYSHGI